MKLTFHKVRYKNLLSTGNVFSEIVLDKSPTTLCVGINGAGKSSFLDALTFCLFNKPYRNINKSNLINSINDKECLVEVDFSAGNNQFMIRRGIKPSVFEIYQNGTLIDQNAASVDYQEYLEDHILGFTYKSFTQIVILGSSFTPFMKLTAGDRRTIIEDLLDLQIFTEMNVIVKEEISGLKNDYSNAKRDMDSALSKMELQRKFIESAKKGNQELIDKKKDELNKNEIEIAGLNIDLLNSNMMSYQEVLSKIGVLGAKLVEIDRLICFYEGNNHCPTCKQDLSKSFRDKTIQSHKEEFNKTEERLKELNQLKEQIAHSTSVETQINTLERTNERLRKEIMDLGASFIIKDDMKQVSKELLNEYQTAETNYKTLVETKALYDVVADVLKDGGIKARIIKQYLPVINSLVNKYLTAMDFFVMFELDEEFDETVKSRHRDIFKYDNFSEGEKQKLDLALLFTWRAVAKMKNSMDTNLLILDEVFDSSLDATGIDNVMKLLSIMDGTNIFVVSHRGDVFVDKFARTLSFHKTSNFSQIVEDEK